MKCQIEKLTAPKGQCAGKSMRVCRKIVRILDNLIDRFLFLLCILIFLIGGYALFDSYAVYYQAADNDILKCKPGYETEEDVNKEIQGFMAAWLTMDGSDIDYPVMQGDDNSEYLSKDPFGGYSLAGSIFLDSRNAPDFTDPYSLIYGHHMEHGMMFGALDEWLDRAYCDNHRTGKLIVGDDTFPLEVFAVLEAEATRKELFAPTETDPAMTFDFIKDHARILYEDSVPGTDERIVALSTCKSPDTSERTIVVCRVLKND